MGTHLLVNTLYIFFAIINSKIIYLIVKSRKIQLFVFITILLLPFSDILIQKIIKSYYSNYEMNAKIYAFPKEDGNGKIESLDLTDSFATWSLKYFENSDINRLNVESFIKEMSFDDKIKEFLEIKIADVDSGNKYLRIRFETNGIKTEFIENGTARYKVNIQTKEKLFGLFTETKYQLIDRKDNNKLLVEAKRVSFPNEKNNFRNKFLLWGTTEDIFKIDSINTKEVIEKLLQVEHI